MADRFISRVQHMVPFAESTECPESPIMFPVGIRETAWKTRDGAYMPLHEHRALVRMDRYTNKPHVLNVVSDGYKLVHNRELFTELKAAIEKCVPADKLMDAYCVDQASQYGRSCIRQYMFPSLKCSLSDKHSKVSFRLIAQNGYGGSALRLHGGAIDGFCANGMISGEFESAYRRHTSGLVIDRIIGVVRKTVEAYTDASGVWAEWSRRHVEREATMRMFREFANSDTLYEKLVDRWLIEREDRGNTLWAAYSTLTNYASHVDDGEFAIRSGDPENRGSTQLNRELNVSRFITSDAWKALVEA